MLLRTILAAGVAAALFASGTAGGQDLSCPVDHVCVDYENTTIALDPAQGPVQAIVVREDSTTSTTFEGTTQSRTATLAVYVSNGDTYDLDSEQRVQQSGLFARASLGDVFVLTEVEDAD